MAGGAPSKAYIAAPLFGAKNAEGRETGSGSFSPASPTNGPNDDVQRNTSNQDLEVEIENQKKLYNGDGLHLVASSY